jgi:hypothetical protein
MLMESCGSNKAGSSRSSSDGMTVREKYLHSESDQIYYDFRKRNQGKVNNFTVDYIGTYKDIAIRKMEEYKIPASITLAQGILESGNGLSELAKKSNNHFGIKCHSSWTGKKVYHDDDRRGECFRKYPSAEGSFNDHSKFLTNRGRYEFLFDLSPDDYKAWAKGLKKAGYATDRKYPKKLISFIENFELYKYDDLVLDDRAYKKYAKANALEIPQESEVAIVERQEQRGGRVAYRSSSIATYRVDKGDTLYSIAREHDLTVEELKELNKLRSNHLDVGQELIVSE